MAIRINLTKDLVDPVRQLPVTYAERFGTTISEESNIMQRIIDELGNFSDERQMAINVKKSKVMKFSMSKTKDFPAEVFVNGDLLEVKEKLRIMGVIFTPNLKWDENTEFICKKAYNKMWAMRRIKFLGLDEFTLLDFYMKEVRVHLELAVPVWHSGLTKRLIADIERVQRVAMGIILGQYEFHYSQGCTMLGLKPLFVRREELCKRFAVNTANPDSKHSDLFQLEKFGSSHETRAKNKYREHIGSTGRFFNSPLPYLTRLLNQ